MKHFMERRDFLKLGMTGAFGMMLSASDLLWRVEQAKAAEI
ncbi:MAG: carbonic anhydrase, partial [Nostoc sp. C3-bin3]|nr:carbonic anhydrase [Nostoc sp. C3-bin3]